MRLKPESQAVEQLLVKVVVVIQGVVVIAVLRTDMPATAEPLENLIQVWEIARVFDHTIASTANGEEIAQAIVTLLERTKLLVEGAGAVTLAALVNGKMRNLSGKTVCLLSGGNIDVKTIAVVVERGLLAAGRYLKLKVELEDVPGSLAKLSTDIAATKANIHLISHERRSISLPLGKTEVLLELETRGCEHIQEVIDHLNGRYKVALA